MKKINRFAVVGIPLSRPDIVEFLLPPRRDPRGAVVEVLDQRPRPDAEAAWIKHLSAQAEPTVADLLAIDDPHNYLIRKHTDRLVPRERLYEPDFLTRDLGGWVANYFGVMGLPEPLPDDPMLRHMEILTDYGPRIRSLGADPEQVAARLEEETGLDAAGVAAAFCYLQDVRHRYLGKNPTPEQRGIYIDCLYHDIEGGRCVSENGMTVPRALLLDELLAQMVRLEEMRREAMAGFDMPQVQAIAQWQAQRQRETGLQLILQAQYIVGRHRRSKVLLAPGLGVVVKQPGLEPLHEIALGAREAMGRPENWPYTTGDGALVTARGRLRLILEEDLVPRISRAFGHQVQFVTLLGLTIEPYIVGTTVQDLVLGDHGQLNAALYEEIMLHQQVCELLGIENGDWHAPNFVMRADDSKLFHIDWGAARPLRDDEHTPEAAAGRVNQVSNMAYSFKDPHLAARLKQLHRELLGDTARMAALRKRAEEIAAKA